MLELGRKNSTYIVKVLLEGLQVSEGTVGKPVCGNGDGRASCRAVVRP